MNAVKSFKANGSLLDGWGTTVYPELGEGWKILTGKKNEVTGLVFKSETKDRTLLISDNLLEVDSSDHGSEVPDLVHPFGTSSVVVRLKTANGTSELTHFITPKRKGAGEFLVAILEAVEGQKWQVDGDSEPHNPVIGDGMPYFKPQCKQLLREVKVRKRWLTKRSRGVGYSWELQKLKKLNEEEFLKATEALKK